MNYELAPLNLTRLSLLCIEFFTRFVLYGTHGPDPDACGEIVDGGAILTRV